MYWDPEVESPASIAVIGAGPVGIEAALYARFLGYNVDIYDAGRPARLATQWNHRSLDVAVEHCTTSLGHAALAAQEEAYRRPALERIFTGREFADEYLTPIAKSDLLYDFVHFNCSIVDVGRYRSHRNDFEELLAKPTQFAKGFTNSAASVDFCGRLQERANDEFRLVVRSRDKGAYTARADIVLDCRGWEKGESGWGPGGSRSIGAEAVMPETYRSLPADTRFEWHAFERKQTILFGRTERAVRFAEEWSRGVKANPREVSLLWIIPLGGDPRDEIVAGDALRLEKDVGDPNRFTLLTTLGIERVERSESGPWRIKMLQSDDSTIDVSGDIFAPFPEARPTPELGSELLPQIPLDLEKIASFAPKEHSNVQHYSDYPGWRIATYEPHYYRLGSIAEPHHPSGLREAYLGIRDLFALLGTRKDLDLYHHFAEQVEPT